MWPCILTVAIARVGFWLGNKSLVDFNAGKTELSSFHRSFNSGAIDVKMNGSILEERLCFKIQGLSLYSKLNWGLYIHCIAKTAPKKIETLMCFSFSWGYSYLSKSTFWPYVEYCCHIRAHNCYLNMLDKVQKLKCRAVDPSNVASLNPKTHFKNVVRLSLHLKWLNWFFFLFLLGRSFVTLIVCMIFLSVLLDIIRMSMSTVCFPTHLDSWILCLPNAFLWSTI